MCDQTSQSYPVIDLTKASARWRNVNALGCLAVPIKEQDALLACIILIEMQVCKQLLSDSHPKMFKAIEAGTPCIFAKVDTTMLQ